MYHPTRNPYFQYKVNFWCRILTGAYTMDKEIIYLVLRFFIAAGIIILIFQEKMPGTWGGFYATVIMGIDLAALTQAVRDSQINKANQSTFDND